MPRPAFSLISRVASSTAAAAMLLFAPAAHAANCSIANVQPLRFGAYDPQLIAGLSTTGRILFMCKNAVPADPIRVVLDAGRNGAGGWTRQLASGPNRLRYQLYLDPAHTLVWGDGTGGSSAWPPEGPLGQGANQLTVYGHIPPGQFVLAGTYTDTITVTVEF